ncbi:MAG: hydrogenase maturation protease [Candidatus Lokiarchaeota archaeon]|nr:hydrogenase maturation protease [Candidatus Lokiarchaeota archaeon]
MNDFLEQLKLETKGATKVAFVGIGEEKMTDDAVGLYIITQLLNNKSNKFFFMNAGVDLMARVDEIIDFNPSHLILIDTCTYNSPPGTVVILKRSNMHEYIPISSHTIPVHIVLDLIVEKLPTIKTFMIGIVPESLDGFVELELFKKGEISIDELNENEDLPFWDIQLTPTIENVANNLIEIIKQLMESL